MTAPVPKRSVIVLWLMPAAAAREFFRETIARLAREWDAPFFEPHLTLGVATDPANLPALGAAPIQLQPVGISWSAIFVKTLFVQMLATPDLESLRDSLGAEGRLSDPHVSLLYKGIPTEEKARLASRLVLPFSNVLFDAVQAVRCPNPTTTRADVESWETIASARLAGVS